MMQTGPTEHNSLTQKKKGAATVSGTARVYVRNGTTEPQESADSYVFDLPIRAPRRGTSQELAGKVVQNRCSPRIGRHRGYFCAEWHDGANRRRVRLPGRTIDEARRAFDEWTPPAAATRQAQFVYFIQCGDAGPIKIGIAQNVERRLADLEIASPYPLRLLGVVSGGQEREGELHRRFASQILKGEWFSPSSELLGYIEIHAKPWVEIAATLDLPKPVFRRRNHHP